MAVHRSIPGRNLPTRHGGPPTSTGALGKRRQDALFFAGGRVAQQWRKWLYWPPAPTPRGAHEPVRPWFLGDELDRCAASVNATCFKDPPESAFADLLTQRPSLSELHYSRLVQLVCSQFGMGARCSPAIDQSDTQAKCARSRLPEPVEQVTGLGLPRERGERFSPPAAISPNALGQPPCRATR